MKRSLSWHGLLDASRLPGLEDDKAVEAECLCRRVPVPVPARQRRPRRGLRQESAPGRLSSCRGAKGGSCHFLSGYAASASFVRVLSDLGVGLSVVVTSGIYVDLKYNTMPRVPRSRKVLSFISSQRGSSRQSKLGSAVLAVLCAWVKLPFW